MPEQEDHAINPGSLKNYVEQHEGSTIDDYLDALSRFRAFVTAQGLTDSELLNRNDMERVTAA